MFLEFNVVNDNGNSVTKKVINKYYIVEATNLSILNGELKGKPACEIKLANGETFRALGTMEDIIKK